jgi:post-segregation antitoxin (ccd killing protein)
MEVLMPKINVYLPDTLATAVKEAGVPVSAVCQAALSDAVERVGRTRRGIAALRDPATSAAALRQIGQGIRRRGVMTPRLIAALRVAASDAEGQDRTVVSSLDLLRGLLDDGENMAVRLLLAQGADVDALADAVADAVAASEAGEPGPPQPESGESDSFLTRLTIPARLACASALEVVVELGHNYIGCEHILIGLTASDGQARDLLAARGILAAAVRQALSAAAAGVAIERSRSAEQNSALADLTRRLEAIERQLAGAPGSHPGKPARLGRRGGGTCQQ